MNKDKIKAALDDLAIWQAKHNAIITHTDDRRVFIDFVEIPPFGSVLFAKYCEQWNSWELNCYYKNEDEIIESIEPSKLSAHEKFKWGLV